MPDREWICANEDDTDSAGREIAALLPPDAAVHLIGDLGAGKTTLARAIAAALGADRTLVASPSFAIIHEYPLPAGRVVTHIDGYRLSESPREWLEIGIDDILAGPGIKLIEWPKKSFEAFEDGHVEIAIEVAADDSRVIRFLTSTAEA
jgi:tRNA threonylcarbamoyl adenosine modification protein YjeE